MANRSTLNADLNTNVPVGTPGAVTSTKVRVILGEVISSAYNVSDDGTPVITTAIGAVNGVASLDGGGKVPIAQLPSLGGITGLYGDLIATGNGIIQAVLPTINSNVGTFGSASSVPVITVDGKGRLTSISSISITGGGGSTSGLANSGDLTTITNNLTISGQTLQNLAIGIGINLSGRLTTTGQNLLTTITNASGALIAQITAAAVGVATLNTVSGAITIAGTGSNITAVTIGQKIFISGNNLANSGDITTLTSNLGLTGQNLYNWLTTTSGQLGGGGATVANLATTGTTLNNKINTLSGFVGNVSGSLAAQIGGGGATIANLQSTGQVLYNDIIGLSGAFSGNSSINVQSTGQTLYNYITNLSGQFSGIWATGIITGVGIFRANNDTTAGSQSIPSNAWTKITNSVLNVENVDVSSYYDVSNAKFQPKTAGWYYVGGSIVLSALDDQAKLTLAITKNGTIPGATSSTEMILCGRGAGSGTNIFGIAGGGILYFNGTTDYAELYLYQGSAGSQTVYITINQYNSFFGYLIGNVSFGSGGGGGGNGTSMRSIVSDSSLASLAVAGNAIYRTSGGAWALSKADTLSTARVDAIVENVNSPNVTLVYAGLITLSGLTVGGRYCLSDAIAGALTVTAPTATTSYLTAVYSAISTTSALVNISSDIASNALLTIADIEIPAAGTLTEISNSITINAATSKSFALTLNANLSTVTLSNFNDGDTINVAITNTISNYTVTWGNSIRWSGGSQPVQTVGAKTDVWTLTKIGSVIYGSSVQNF